MKQRRLVLLLLMLTVSLAACSPGHLGNNVIAFIRDGHLWTIDPNGTNAFDTVAQDTPVIGYSWSPNHQLLVFRTLDSSFARTAPARHLESNPLTGQIADIPSTVNTIGVDGGSPIPIAFSSPEIRYSMAMWNITGTRLLYRQTPQTPPSNSDAITWWVSQNDQPGGIAIKSLPNSYSIPSLSYGTQQQLALGNSSQGVFTTTLTGANQHFVQHTALGGHPLPATLERVLWQPAHQDERFLYAVLAPSFAASTTDPNTLAIQLRLGTMDGQSTLLTTCNCTQFAWSPDGNFILYSTGENYTIMNLSNRSSFDVTGVNGSMPYWSPDSQFLLLDGLHTIILVRIANGQKTLLLHDTAASETNSTPLRLPAANVLLQPVANNIWAADSRHFLFLTHNRLHWQNTAMSMGEGLYTASIDDIGHPQGSPAIIDRGNDTQPGWTYQDANTSFLL